MKAALNGTASHKHNGLAVDGYCCPLCEAPVTHDRLIELQVIEQERFAEIETRVRVQVGNERDAEIARVQQQGLAAVDAAQRAAAKRETVIQREVQATVTAALAPKLAEATAAKKLADQQMKELRAGIEATLKQQLAAQAEALEKAANERVNAEKTLRHADSLRYQQALEDLKRKQAKERPAELGERGELDLFEILTNEFPADQFCRVGKGIRGADIVQRVFNGGAFTGRLIIYDSKNHRAWMSKWIPKLRGDQIEAKADHAVLVSTVFPAGKSHLMVENGVVVCSPARVVAVAHMLRNHVLQSHGLRLSNADRTEKTQRLYDLLTSDRAAERWERLSAAVSELTEIEGTDAAHQQRVRDKRLSKVRAIAAVHDEFVGDIDAIVRGESGDPL